MLISCALARRRLSSDPGSSALNPLTRAADADSTKSSGSGAIDIDFLTASADNLCRHALLMFPELVLPLLTKFNDKEPGKPKWQGALKGLSSIYSPVPNVAAYVDKLCGIYAERSAALWSDETIGWLLARCESIVADIASGVIASAELIARDQIRVRTFDCAMPLKLKLLQKSEYSDAVLSVPEEMRRGAGRLPLEQELAQLRGMQMQVVNGRLMGLQDGELVEFPMPSEDQMLDLNSHPLSAFFRTLLPWVQVPPEGWENRRDGDDDSDDSEEEIELG